MYAMLINMRFLRRDGFVGTNCGKIELQLTYPANNPNWQNVVAVSNG